MKKSALTRIVAGVLVPALIGLNIAGCEGQLGDSELSVQPGQVRLTVESSDGDKMELAGSYEEMVQPLVASVPSFTADGEQTSDAAELLEASRVELDSGGEKLVLERAGSLIRRTQPEPSASDAATEVTWDDTATTLQVLSQQRQTTVKVQGIDDDTARRTYVGRVALAALAGEEWLVQPPGRQPQVVGAVILVAITVIGAWPGIVHVVCRGIANWKCRNRGGVRSLGEDVLGGLPGKYRGVCKIKCVK
jgi:hypothetical protein